MRAFLPLNRIQIMDDPVNLIAAQRVLVEIVRKIGPHAEVVGERHMVGLQRPSGADSLGNRRLVLCRFDKPGIGDEPDGCQHTDNRHDGQHLDHRKARSNAENRTGLATMTAFLSP